MPMALASLLCPSVARVLAHRIGYRTVLTGGSVTVASSFGCFSLAHSNVVHILVMMLLLGIGIGVGVEVGGLRLTWTRRGWWWLRRG